MFFVGGTHISILPSVFHHHTFKFGQTNKNKKNKKYGRIMMQVLHVAAAVGEKAHVGTNQR